MGYVSIIMSTIGFVSKVVLKVSNKAKESITCGTTGACNLKNLLLASSSFIEIYKYNTSQGEDYTFERRLATSWVPSRCGEPLSI